MASILYWMNLGLVFLSLAVLQLVHLSHNPFIALMPFCFAAAAFQAFRTMSKEREEDEDGEPSDVPAS